MKNHIKYLAAIILICLLSISGKAQQKSDFWRHVSFGGGIGANVGSGFTDIGLSPGAIYNFNDYVAAGVGLSGSYSRLKGEYESYVYGGSLIGLFNPIPELQVSLEPELLRVNTDFRYLRDDNFFVPNLFTGIGYRVENVAVGIRYNVLYRESRSAYSDPWMPFIRAYF